MSDEIDLKQLQDVEEDEEQLFVDSGYLKPPKKFKRRHNFGTGPKTFDGRFPNPTSFMKQDDKYEYVIYRWERNDLNNYQQTKNAEKKEGDSNE